VLFDNPTLLLVTLIVFAFAVSRLLHRYAERVGLVSGIEYALVGVSIGPLTPFGLVDQDTLHTLDLLVALLLGMLGFMVGMRARSALARFEHFLAGSLSALVVALVVAFGVLGIVQWVEPAYLADESPLIDIAVAADAPCGSPSPSGPRPRSPPRPPSSPRPSARTPRAPR
jgi:Kef-type K+ transport system membrane component KefB